MASARTTGSSELQGARLPAPTVAPLRGCASSRVASPAAAAVDAFRRNCFCEELKRCRLRAGAKALAEYRVSVRRAQWPRAAASPAGGCLTRLDRRGDAGPGFQTAAALWCLVSVPSRDPALSSGFPSRRPLARPRPLGHHPPVSHHRHRRRQPQRRLCGRRRGGRRGRPPAPALRRSGTLATIDVTSARGFSISTSIPNLRDQRSESHPRLRGLRPPGGAARHWTHCRPGCHYGLNRSPRHPMAEAACRS